MLLRTLTLCVFLVGCGGGNLDANIQHARAAAPDGGKLYDAKCSDCHGQKGQGSFGTPATLGSGSLDKYATAKDLFEYVHTKMPLPKAQAGSLSEPDYWAIVSFLVAAHGRDLPPGGLSKDNAASVSLH